MTPLDVCRAAVPGCDEAFTEHVLYGRTPFPMRPVSVRELYRAASRVRRATAQGLKLCDLCDRIATDGWQCDECTASMDSARARLFA